MNMFVRSLIFFSLVLCGLTPSPYAKDRASGNNSIDLRKDFEQLGLRPRSQGGRGTCSVFVVTEAFEYALAKSGCAFTRLSPEFINWASNQVTGYNQDGSYFEHAIDGVMKYGFCLDSEFPYRSAFDPSLSPPDEIRGKAMGNLRRVERLLRPKVVWISPLGNKGLSRSKIQEAVDVLQKGWPVGIGAGHSLLLVGFDGDLNQLESGVFHVLDSATASFHTVSYEYLHNEVIDVFYVCCRNLTGIELGKKDASKPANKADAGGGK